MRAPPTLTRALVAAQATHALAATRILAGCLLVLAVAVVVYRLGYLAGKKAGREVGHWDGWDAHIRTITTRRIG